MGRNSGFTLVEIIVVLGIIVLLLAITVPVGLSLQARNRLGRCESNMHKIYQGHKMYRLDEGGFPPYYFDVATSRIQGRGLLALHDNGYLKGTGPLRCSADYEDYSPEIAAYGAAANGYDHTDAITYQWLDLDAVASPTGVPAFKYLSDRGIAPTDPDVDRVPAHRRGAMFQPDDTTVLTWCNYHEKVVTEGGKGQYLVLFYDGRINRMDADLFRLGDSSTTPPEEPWRVWPNQVAWNAGAPVY